MSPGFWLHHASLEWRAIVERNLRPLGLTLTVCCWIIGPDWNYCALCATPPGPSPRDLMVCT